MMTETETYNVVISMKCPCCGANIPMPPTMLSAMKLTYGHGIVNTTLSSVVQPNPGLTNPPRNPRPHPPRSPVGHTGDRMSSLTKPFLLISGSVEITFTVIIFILEIAALGLGRDSATGAGIWCSIPFLAGGITNFLFALEKLSQSKRNTVIALIAQIVLFVFSFILIGISGSYVASYEVGSYYTTVSSAQRSKYQVMQAQLAFAILLMFTGLVCIVFYSIVLFLKIRRRPNQS